MTNGEKIKETFPNTIIIGCESYIQVMGEKYEFNNTYPLDWWNAEYQEPTTTKNNLGVDCIDRTELLKAIDTWDKFGCDADTKLVSYQDHYIPYIHYDDVIKCIKSMSSVTPQLSVPEVTALAEWTAKLTKASEDAYNKGYADGMKAQEPRKGHWIPRNAYLLKYKCSECNYKSEKYNFCPNCGAKMEEVEE